MTDPVNSGAPGAETNLADIEPPTSPEALMAELDRLGIAHRTMEHPPLHTVEESKALRGDIPGAHTKNLFLKDKKGNIFLLTAREDTPVNLKRIHTVIGGSGRVSFGKPDLLMDVLGVRPGAVTAFGLINDRGGRVRFALDATLMGHDEISCHPLVNTMTTTIARDDLFVFARATGHEPLILDLADL